MPGPMNWDEQKRQQEYRNWKASQQALGSLPGGGRPRGEGRKDRRSLAVTVLALAGVFAALVLLSRLIQ